MSIFRVYPLIGSSQTESKVKTALCHFVCSESHPDAESYCRDVIYPMGFQLEGLEREYCLTEEHLLETDRQMFDMYLLAGHATQFVGWKP